MQEQENESGGSSEDTNSMHVEDSFHEYLSLFFNWLQCDK